MNSGNREVEKLEFAEDMLRSSYDLSSCGIGVQRQLTRYLANEPEAILGERYLIDALSAGPRSNLVAYLGSIFEEIIPFDRKTYLRLRCELDGLWMSWRELEDSLWVHLASGQPFKGPVHYSWGVKTARDLLQDLTEKGYFSGIPPNEEDDFILEFIKGGINTNFVVKLVKADGDLDFEKIKKDEHRLILGEGKPHYVRFHARKLSLMADLADEAYKLRRELTGEEDYAIPETEEKWRNNWKRMFGEETPAVTQLICSARETAENALASIE